MEVDAAGGAEERGAPPPNPPGVDASGAEFPPRAVDDLPPAERWMSQSTNLQAPARPVTWGPACNTGGAAAPTQESGVRVSSRVLVTAFAHVESGLLSGNVIPNGAVYLMRAFSVIGNLHGVGVSAACPVPLLATPAEPDAARLRVEGSTSPRMPDDKGTVSLISIVANIEGDSARICSMLKDSRTLTFKGHGPNGAPTASVLQLRMQTLATMETQAALASSATALSHGSPMLVSAPHDGTLGQLQSELDAILEPAGFGGTLLMPHAHTASSSQRIVAKPRDDGNILPDWLSLTVWDLREHSEPARLELRKQLGARGFQILHADSLEDLQPGGRALAAFDPRLAVLLTGPAAAVGSADSARRFVYGQLENLPDDVTSLVGYDQSARQADQATLSSAPVLVSPTVRRGAGSRVTACIVLPSDAAVRSLLGATTVPRGTPSKPLAPASTLGGRVSVELADFVHRRRVEADVSCHALLRHRSNDETRGCANGCGAASHHRGIDPAFAHLRSVCGEDGAAVYLAALEAEVRGSPNCRSLDMLHLDKPWSKLPAQSQSELQLSKNAHLLAARQRLQSLRGFKAPKGDVDPEPKGSPAGRCLRVGGRPGCGFHFACRHCLLAGHPASGCVLSPERDRYCAATASVNRAAYLATLARSSPRLFGGTPAAVAATPLPASVGHQGDWNQRVTSLLAQAAAAASALPTPPPVATAAAAPPAASPEPSAGAPSTQATPLPPLPAVAPLQAATLPPPAAAPPAAHPPAAAAAPAAAPPPSAPPRPPPQSGVGAIAPRVYVPRDGTDGGWQPVVAARGRRGQRAPALGEGAAARGGNYHLRRQAINLPGGTISGYALVRGGSGDHMSDEEAPGLAGAKRTHDLRTPPRRGFGALAEHEGDDKEEDEEDEEEEVEEAPATAPACPPHDYALSVSHLPPHYAKAIEALPLDTPGIVSAQAAVDSVPESDRGGDSWLILCRVLSEHPDSFNGLNPLEACMQLMVLFREKRNPGRAPPAPGHRYPAPSLAHRREDVSLGRRSPPPAAKSGRYSNDAGHPARHAAAASAAKAAPEGNAPADLFSGLNRGFLSHPTKMAKGAAPAVALPPAGPHPHPGKDPPHPAA